MEARSRHVVAQRGFTLIELIIVILIMVVMMGLFMERVSYYQERAEKSAMETVAGTIQSALSMQYGQIMTRGKPSDIAALAQDNPMNWLQKKPQNYAGEFYDPAPSSVAEGSWAYDLKTGDLVYFPRNSEALKSGSDGRKWIRFRVAVQQDASRLPSQQDAPPQLTGLLFEPVEPYAWF
ncbi:MAG: prepilin-type N-terminal cleavage/methylation domain-containing protein [Gallionella sp.]|nr:prepilin-type N-terminal cleavage/methylation domain-containing protein [Gallionella sp.]